MNDAQQNKPGGRSGRRRSGRRLKVAQLDLRDQHQALKREIAHALAEVINSGSFILGPKVAAFEEAVAHYSSARHGIGVASGTDALILSLRVLGIGPGDEVITSSYSFIASASAIALCGARPVFVDIDPATWNMDPDAVEAAVTERTRAILPVHLFGQCVAMDPILDIAARHQLSVIEDAAQALGAEDNGRRAGSLGTLGCFSFYPTKNLGGMGDGGMIVTSDDELSDKLRVRRVHGARPKYVNHVLGLNSRLDALQAALLIVKLQHLEQYTDGRRQHAHYYNDRFKELPCERPVERPRCRHIYNQYAIRVPERDRVAATLKEKGVDTAVYYPIPLHRQEVFADLGYREGQFPHAEEAARTTLCLPIYPELTKRAREHVANQLIAILRPASARPGRAEEDAAGEAVPARQAPAAAPEPAAEPAPATEATPAAEPAAEPAPATEATPAAEPAAEPAPATEATPAAEPAAEPAPATEATPAAEPVEAPAVAGVPEAAAEIETPGDTAGQEGS